MLVFKVNADFAKDELQTLRKECVGCMPGAACDWCPFYNRIEVLEAHFEAVQDHYDELTTW